MSIIQGFRLIDQVSESVQKQLMCENGNVDYEPVEKYKYKKTNPLDPGDIWRIGKYYVATFGCKVPVTAEEFDELLDFINDATELKISFNHGKNSEGNPLILTFTITDIKKLPVCPDNMHLYREFTKFNLVSIFDTFPAGVVEVGIIDDDEIIL